jgi:hypothetical protein
MVVMRALVKKGIRVEWVEDSDGPNVAVIGNPNEESVRVWTEGLHVELLS